MDLASFGSYASSAPRLKAKDQKSCCRSSSAECLMWLRNGPPTLPVLLAKSSPVPFILHSKWWHFVNRLAAFQGCSLDMRDGEAILLMRPGAASAFSSALLAVGIWMCSDMAGCLLIISRSHWSCYIAEKPSCRCDDADTSVHSDSFDRSG